MDIFTREHVTHLLEDSLLVYSDSDLVSIHPVCMYINFSPWYDYTEITMNFSRVVLPVIQSYSTAGEFTVLGRLRSAIIANLIFYGTYLVIFCICLIYVAARPDLHLSGYVVCTGLHIHLPHCFPTMDEFFLHILHRENLKVIGITASNTWGLFLLVLLYGYGLVDVPRSVWQASYTHLTLQQTYFKIAKLSMECSEAKEKYEDTLEVYLSLMLVISSIRMSVLQLTSYSVGGKKGC